MVQQGQGGSLVATASTAAVEGAARNSHYDASKGAVTAMVRALAVELARHKIRVNLILPGWIETDMTHKSVTNLVADVGYGLGGMFQITHPERIAAAHTDLASRGT